MLPVPAVVVLVSVTGVVIKPVVPLSMDDINDVSAEVPGVVIPVTRVGVVPIDVGTETTTVVPPPVTVNPGVVNGKVGVVNGTVSGVVSGIVTGGMLVIVPRSDAALV